MGIRGIDNLIGGTMESDPQGQPVPGQQQDESASPAPTQPEAPTSVPQEAEQSVPAPDVAPGGAPETESVPAPDADEPGDTDLPPELEQHVHDGEVPPDNVDQEG